MSTDSETTIAHLFANEAPAVAPASPDSSMQPPPPEPDGYQPLTQEAEPPAVQATPGQEQPPAEPQQSPQRMVPLPELMETRKRAQAAEAAAEAARRETAQLKDMLLGRLLPQQPQPQPAPQPTIDPVEDPQGFARAIEARIEQRFLNENLNRSEHQARTEFGSDVVDAALEAARNSGYAQVFVNKPDAYREMVNWHKAQQLQQQVGDSSSDYMKNLEAQVRAKVLAEMRAGTPPPANLPPTLSTAARVQNASEVIGTDRDFFKEMMNPRRQPQRG